MVTTVAPADVQLQERNVGFVAYTEYSSDPRVRREAEMLALRGYEVHVISVRSTSGTGPEPPKGIHLHEVPMVIRRGGRARYVYQYAMFFLGSMWLLTQIGLRNRLTTVHVHTLPDFQIFCAVLLKCRGSHLVLDLHEALPEILRARFRISTSSLLYKAAVVAEQLSCRFADCVIAANDGIKAAVVARGIPDTHITTIYTPAAGWSGAVPPNVKSLAVDLLATRIMVHAGGINGERDLETCITALSLLRETERPTLIMVGDGDPRYIENLLKLAASLGVLANVRYLGTAPPDVVMALMSASEIGLVTLQSNPLTRLAWPTRVVEFVALGKPILAPALEFLSKTLGDSAVYYIPGDPRSLAERVSYILTHPEENHARALRARTACISMDATHAADSLIHVYNSLDNTIAENAALVG